MAEVYFWSDLHFGHEMVARLRGYDTVMAHDAALYGRMRDRLSKGDQLWLLGDLALSRWRDALCMLDQLKVETRAELHLILGNHDKPHPLYRDSHKHLRTYMDTFESVQTMARRKIAGQSVMLSHFPYTGDHTETHRHLQYRLRDAGSWLIHGHVHSAERWDGDRQIHVGVDAWRDGPVPLSEIQAIMPTQVELNTYR